MLDMLEGPGADTRQIAEMKGQKYASSQIGAGKGLFGPIWEDEYCFRYGFVTGGYGVYLTSTSALYLGFGVFYFSCILELVCYFS